MAVGFYVIHLHFCDLEWNGKAKSSHNTQHECELQSVITNWQVNALDISALYSLEEKHSLNDT